MINVMCTYSVAPLLVFWLYDLHRNEFIVFSGLNMPCCYIYLWSVPDWVLHGTSYVPLYINFCYIYLLQAANALMLYMDTDTCCHLFLVTYMCVHGHEHLLSRSHEWQLYISILIHIRISLLPCLSCHIYASIYIFLGIILFDLAEYA